MALAFPQNPAEGQVYDYPPFRYQFTSGRWLTVGKGANTVSEAILAHEAAPNIHSMAAIQWQGGLSHRNLLINGDFRIRQRAEYADVVANTYPYSCADRWITGCSGGPVRFGVSAAHDWGGMDVERTVMRIEGSSAMTSAVVVQRVESQNCTVAEGKNLTISARVYTNAANVSFTLRLDSVSSVAKLDDWSAAVTVGSKNFTLVKDSWNVVTFTAPATLACRGGMAVGLEVRSNIPSGSSVYITDVQLERGSVATPFENRPYGYEFGLCQRYCRRLSGVIYISHKPIFGNSGWASSVHSIYMRNTPTISASSVNGETGMTRGGLPASFAPAINQNSGSIRVNVAYATSETYAFSLGGTTSPPDDGYYAYAAYNALLDAEL